MNNPSAKVLEKKYNFKIEYKLINNKPLLKSRLSEIPKSSGCYLFKDIDNNLLYIGTVSYTHLPLPTKLLV